MEKIKKELANIFGYVEQLSPKEMELLGIEDIKRMRIGNLEYRMVLSLIKRVYTQAKEAGRKEERLEILDEIEGRMPYGTKRHYKIIETEND